MDSRYVTSDKEIKDLVTAWIALTLAVTILFTDPLRGTQRAVNYYLVFFAISFVTAGSGFLLHELAHKVIAQRFGFWAEFRADYEMLGVALVSALIGFLFAAPGAVMIRGDTTRLTIRKSGLISVAGPVTNLLLFSLFALVFFLFGINSLLIDLSRFGMFINAFLAAFNMAPFGPLDGVKVREWSTSVFVVVFIMSILLAIYTWTLL